jgi:hypothetical protein
MLNGESALQNNEVSEITQSAEGDRTTEIATQLRLFYMIKNGKGRSPT